MATLATLISSLQEENEEVIISGTTTSAGGVDHIIDTARTEADDYWEGCYLYIVSSTESAIVGQERDITSNAASAAKVYIAPNFSAAVPTGTAYEIRRKRSRADYKNAVNFGILAAQGWRNEMAVDNSNIVQEDKLEYVFPTGLLFLSEIWVEQYTVLYKRTATGGAAGYLQDTGANFGSDVDGEKVAIYGGTGKGQSRSISSHTATQLNVSPNWTTIPNSTSKYVVKQTSKQELPPAVLIGYRADMAGLVIRLAAEPADQGQTMFIIYEKAPVKLTADIDATTIPERFVVLKGMVRLLSERGGEEPDRGARFLIQMYQTEAEVFKGQNPAYRLPMKQTIYPGEGAVSSNWPYGNPLW